MLFTDDTDASLQAAVALVNSTDEPGEPLGSVDDLSAFLAEHIGPPRVVSPAVS